jgi:CRP-like cAMP-binding protein
MLNKSISSCIDCSMKSPLFNFLSEEELQLVTRTKKHVFFKAGEIIAKQGVPMSHVISFNQGLAKVYIEGSNDRNFILQFIKPTQFLGGPGIFVDQIHYFSVAAIHDSAVCFIDIDVFKKILRQNINFNEAFMENQSKSTIYNYDRFISLNHKNMHGRIVDALIYLHKNIFNDDKNRIDISRQDLAELTGMSKDSVIRTLKELCEDNLLKSDSQFIYILDMNKLERISEVS